MITIPLPGGEAVLRDPRALTVRQKRPLEIVIDEIGFLRLRDIILAASVEPDPTDDGVELTEEEQEAFARAREAGVKALQITRAERLLLAEMSDATIWALTAEWWDVDEAGARTVQHQLPRSVEEISDLPDDIYDALGQATAKLQASDMLKHGFDIDAVEDHTSPTGAFEGSTPSSEAAPSPASTQPEPLPGASTGTGPWSGV